MTVWRNKVKRIGWRRNFLPTKLFDLLGFLMLGVVHSPDETSLLFDSLEQVFLSNYWQLIWFIELGGNNSKWIIPWQSYILKEELYSHEVLFINPLSIMFCISIKDPFLSPITRLCKKRWIKLSKMERRADVNSGIKFFFRQFIQV